MSTEMNFRSAINGFHRMDVVNYMESYTLESKKTINQLTTRNDELQSELDNARSEIRALKKDLSAAKDATLPVPVIVAEEEVILAEIVEPVPYIAPVEVPYIPAPVIQFPTPVPNTQELAAYRRAEATERSAARRAQNLRVHVTDLLDSTSSLMENSSTDINELMQDLSIIVSKLTGSCVSLKMSFDETITAFDAIELATDTNTEDEELI